MIHNFIISYDLTKQSEEKQEGQIMQKMHQRKFYNMKKSKSNFSICTILQIVGDAPDFLT